MLIYAVGLLVVVVVFVVPPALVVRAVLAGRRQGLPLRRALLTPGPLIAVGIVALAGAGVAALVGWLSGFYLLDPDQMCATSAGLDGRAAGSWTGIERQVFPVRQTCVWADGTSYELVPGWVNPVLVGFVVVALAAFGEAVVRKVGRPGRDPADVRAGGPAMR